MKTTKTIAIFSAALTAFGILAGCSNVGDTNPVTPEKMQQMRNQQDQERANFQGGNAPPKPEGTPQ